MKLFSLIKNINCRVVGNTNIQISGLYHKDTEVKENGLFFCLRGTNADGRDYILSAINNGAPAIITEQEIPNLPKITQIIVKNAREAMSLISCKFYGNPADKLTIIGVTGTNGKTTISTMLYSSLNNLGKKAALIGTNGIYIDNLFFDTGMTTPDPIELHKYFSMMIKKNIEFVCMEVSAHAIALNKLEGFKFAQMIFTNLTEDHLDYFKTLDNYFNTKSKIFTQKNTNLAIINVDDECGKILAESIKIPYLTYSINENIFNFQNTDISEQYCKFNNFNSKISHIFAKNIKISKNASHFKTNNNTEFSIQLLGNFNISNCLAVISSLKHFGFTEDEISKNLKNIKQVNGRFNTYKINDGIIVIDYAHTPDGLKNALITCREIASDCCIICVFGCGGNRDKDKRKIMGEIASKYADYSIITTDNPRFEPREKIANDIANGFLENNYSIILDRANAIKTAISINNRDFLPLKSTNFNIKCKKIILIAGKGSENYIDECGEKIKYNDYDVIKNYIEK